MFLFSKKIKSRFLAPLLRAFNDALGITSMDILLGKNYRWIVSLIRNSNSYPDSLLLPKKWSVFSQFNEDSIINDCLLAILSCEDTSNLAVEFGSGGYSSNIALTAATFNLRVLMVDGSKTQLRLIKKTLTTALRLLPEARSKITYVHKLLSPSTINHDITEIINHEVPVIASVDIDSFDELVIKDLMSRKVPLIVAEYNSCFGPDATISNYTKSSSHNMIQVDGITMPIIGLSFKYLLTLAKKNHYTCYCVEENGVNMVLVHTSFVHLFSSIEQPVFQKNVLYPYEVPHQTLEELENTK